MGIENIYLKNLKKIFLFSPTVAILLFLCCPLSLGFVCVWQNCTLRQNIGSRHVFIKDFCKFIWIMQNCESTAVETSELEMLWRTSMKYSTKSSKEHLVIKHIRWRENLGGRGRLVAVVKAAKGKCQWDGNWTCPRYGRARRVMIHLQESESTAAVRNDIR